MPSFGDTALIALIALLLFGPKKLPELARQLGKLMGEFRRASNDFRMQMEEELRVAEQSDRQKEIAAMQAAAPVAPPLLQDESVAVSAENTIAAAETPLPIATSGDLAMMPPSTGLPMSRSPLSPVLDSIPHTQEPEATAQPSTEQDSHEASPHG